MHQQTYLRLTLYTTRPSTVVNNITSVLGAMTRRKQYKFFSNHVVSFINLNSLMCLNRHFKCLFTIQITQLQVTYVTQMTFCNLFFVQRRAITIEHLPKENYVQNSF